MGLRYRGNVIRPGYNVLASNITTGVNTAQYQGVFTLPQQLQAITPQQWVSDPLFRNTTLLLQADNAVNGAQNNTFLDSSTNAFTITRTGTPTQGAFSPFSQPNGWWSNFLKGGSYLPGYISVLDNAALRPNANPFTLEFWVNFSNLTGVQTVFSKGGTATGQIIIQTSTGTGVLNVLLSGTTIITASSGSSVGVWDHYALVRQAGNIWTLYRNGVSVGSQTGNSTSINTNANIDIGSNPSTSGQLLTGFISNLRLTIGTALYTASFTPSLTPLTTTSQGASASEVKLLTCQSNRFVDNSTNNWSIGPTSGGVFVQTYSPFNNPPSQFTSSGVGGSGQFSTAGDTLLVANNAAFQFGTGDFTVEGWVHVSPGIGQGIIVKCAVDATWSNGWALSLNGAATGFAFYVNGSVLLSSTADFAVNAWYHVAVTRSGTTNTLWINGVSRATATSANNYAPTALLSIGGDISYTPYTLRGLVAGVRVVKGTAVYTTAFTPPTSPPTAITNTSLLCNFSNAGMYDGAMKNNFLSANNAQVSTAVVKYGSGSMFFDGVDDYLSVGTAFNTWPLFSFGTGQFTIEAWVNFTVLSGNRMIVDTYTAASTGGGYQLYWRSTGTNIAFYANGVVVAQSSFTAHLPNVWYHIAVTRDSSNTLRIFIDGVQYASTTYATAINIDDSAALLAVGIQRGTLTNDLAGYIDDLRITNGVARYTANFTPPQVALPRQ